MHELAVERIDRAEDAAAELHEVAHNGVEHGLRVGGRTRNNTKYLGGSPLLLACLGELARERSGTFGFGLGAGRSARAAQRRAARRGRGFRFLRALGHQACPSQDAATSIVNSPARGAEIADGTCRSCSPDGAKRNPGQPLPAAPPPPISPR